MSVSINFHTEHEDWCTVTSRHIDAQDGDGLEPYIYIDIRIPSGGLGMFFRDPAVLDKFADKCREAAKFLRAQKDVKDAGGGAALKAKLAREASMTRGLIEESNREEAARAHDAAGQTINWEGVEFIATGPRRELKRGERCDGCENPADHVTPMRSADGMNGFLWCDDCMSHVVAEAKIKQ